MPQTNTTNLRIDGAYVRIGDPTTSDGADMANIGLVPEVSFDIQTAHQVPTNELGQELRGGREWVLGATVTMTVMDESFDVLAAFSGLFTNDTESFGANTDSTAISHLTMCIIPQDVADSSASTDPKTTWIPSVRIDGDVGSFTNTVQAGGGEDANSYTVTFRAQLCATDQDGQAILNKGRIIFRGDPDDVIDETTPTSWSLPADLTA